MIPFLGLQVALNKIKEEILPSAIIQASCVQLSTQYINRALNQEARKKNMGFFNSMVLIKFS